MTAKKKCGAAQPARRSNYILSERELKRLVRSAYWKGANSVHPGESITISEVEDLDAAFDVWWKAHR